VSGEGERRRPHRWAVRLVAGGCLAVCAFEAFRHPEPQLTDPLTIALIACAICAAIAYVDFEGTIFLDGSLVPLLLAAIFIGPAAAFVLPLVAEATAWARQRYRVSAALINATVTAAPNLLAAEIFMRVDSRTGFEFYVAIAGATAMTLILNFVLLVTLIGFHDGRPIRPVLSHWRRVVPAFVLNVVLVVAAANVYVNVGAGALAFVLVVVLAFAYLITQVFAARERAERISDLASSRRRLVAQALGAEDRERRRLANYLHDGPVQDLMVVRQELAEATPDVMTQSSHLDTAIESAISQLRQVVSELHPAVLERRGVGRALEVLAREQAERAGFTVSVEIDRLAAQSPDRLVYAVARELVVNVAKHARASHVYVRLTREERKLVISVEDDGRGIDPARRRQAALAGHIGLASIEDRVDAIGGAFSIRPAATGGTVCRVELPEERLAGTKPNERPAAQDRNAGASVPTTNARPPGLGAPH
jgi:two-component system NarL family sensor kinase